MTRPVQMGKGKENILKVPRTQRPLHTLRVQVIHERDKSRLRRLLDHGIAFDGLDFGHGRCALLKGGEAADVG